MGDTQNKNKLLFDFYENIRLGTEIMSLEDLEAAIKTLEQAREELKSREQVRRRAAKKRSTVYKATPSGNTLYLPANTKRLDREAYKNNREIVKLVINLGCTEIGEGAFEGCVNLKEIVFPENRILLRKNAFKGCTSLTAAILPDAANICPSAFEGCTSLRRVFLPRSISNIYSRAFKNCTSLKEVRFSSRSDNHIIIHPFAFHNCRSLEAIELPKHASADPDCFVGCANLKEILVHDIFWLFRGKFFGCNAKIKKI